MDSDDNSADEEATESPRTLKELVFDGYKLYVDEVCQSSGLVATMYSLLNVHIGDTVEQKRSATGGVKSRNAKNERQRLLELAELHNTMQCLVAGVETFDEYTELLRAVSRRILKQSTGEAGQEDDQSPCKYEACVHVCTIQQLHTVYGCLERLCLVLFRRGPYRAETHYVHTRDYGLAYVEPLIGEQLVTLVLQRLGYQQVQQCDVSAGNDSECAAAKSASTYQCNSNVFELLIRENLLAYRSHVLNQQREQAESNELDELRMRTVDLARQQVADWLHSAYDYFLIKNELRLAVETGSLLDNGDSLPSNVIPSALLAALWRAVLLKQAIPNADMSSITQLNVLLQYADGSRSAMLFALDRVLAQPCKSRDSAMRMDELEQELKRWIEECAQAESAAKLAAEATANSRQVPKSERVQFALKNEWTAGTSVGSSAHWSAVRTVPVSQVLQPPKEQKPERQNAANWSTVKQKQRGSKEVKQHFKKAL